MHSSYNFALVFSQLEARNFVMSIICQIITQTFTYKYTIEINKVCSVLFEDDATSFTNQLNNLTVCPEQYSTSLIRNLPPLSNCRVLDSWVEKSLDVLYHCMPQQLSENFQIFKTLYSYFRSLATLNCKPILSVNVFKVFSCYQSIGYYGL